MERTSEIREERFLSEESRCTSFCTGDDEPKLFIIYDASSDLDERAASVVNPNSIGRYSRQEENIRLVILGKTVQQGVTYRMRVLLLRMEKRTVMGKLQLFEVPKGAKAILTPPRIPTPCLFYRSDHLSHSQAAAPMGSKAILAPS